MRVSNPETGEGIGCTNTEDSIGDDKGRSQTGATTIEINWTLNTMWIDFTVQSPKEVNCDINSSVMVKCCIIH